MAILPNRPDLVITHSAHDLHWDHNLVNRATVSSLRRWPCNLLAYVSSYEMNAQNSTRTVGQCFADRYRMHPNAGMVAILQPRWHKSQSLPQAVPILPMPQHLVHPIRSAEHNRGRQQRAVEQIHGKASF